MSTKNTHGGAVPDDDELRTLSTWTEVALISAERMRLSFKEWQDAFASHQLWALWVEQGRPNEWAPTARQNRA